MFALHAVGIQRLKKVTAAIEQSDCDQRQPDICRGADGIAGQDAEAPA
jgi:hypothetical protein